MSSLTSWVDLSKVNIFRQDILNAIRSHIRNNAGQVYINEGPGTDQYQWYCYNKVDGTPYITSDIPVNSVDEEIDRIWDNRTNSDPLGPIVYHHEWTDVVTTTAQVTTVSDLNINANFSFDGFGAGVAFDINTSDTKSHEDAKTETESEDYTVNVAPGKYLAYLKKTTTSGSNRTWALPVTASGWIWTDGDKFEDHYYWAYSLDY